MRGEGDVIGRQTDVRVVAEKIVGGFVKLAIEGEGWRVCCYTRACRWGGKKEENVEWRVAPRRMMEEMRAMGPMRGLTGASALDGGVFTAFIARILEVFFMHRHYLSISGSASGPGERAGAKFCRWLRRAHCVASFWRRRGGLDVPRRACIRPTLSLRFRGRFQLR